MAERGMVIQDLAALAVARVGRVEETSDRLRRLAQEERGHSEPQLGAAVDRMDD